MRLTVQQKMFLRMIAVPVLSIGTVLPPAQLSAQFGSPAVQASGGVVSDPGCTNGGVGLVTVQGSGSASIDCYGDALSRRTAFASNVAGELRAGTGAAISGGFKTTLTGVGSQSLARWSDVLQFSVAPGSSPPSFVEFVYTLTGRLDSFAAQGGFSSSSVDFQSYASFNGAITPLSGRRYTSSVSFDNPGDVFRRIIDVSENVVLRVPLLGTPLSGEIEFFAYLATTSIGRVRSDPFETVSFLSSADFTNTAKLSDLRFLDASGASLSNGTSFSFRGDTQIFQVTPVPEPRAEMLMLFGVLFLGGVSLRRKQDHHV